MDEKSHEKNKKLFFLSFAANMSISIEKVFYGIASFSVFPVEARPGMSGSGLACAISYFLNQSFNHLWTQTGIRTLQPAGSRRSHLHQELRRRG
jgi:hypothetical protein